MEFTITLQPSGRRYRCDSGTSILKAGLAAGLFMPYSCRSGVCNTCRGRVLDGQIDWGATHPKYLNDSDKAKGHALLCQAMPRSDVTVEVAEVEDGALTQPKYMPVRILRTALAAPDVMIVTVGLPMNEPTLFRAGQYIELVAQDGVRRSYSVASQTHNEGVRQIELHVRHCAGGRFTDWLFAESREKAVLRAQFPLGSFFLRTANPKPIVLLASGTGFAPIQSIITSHKRAPDSPPMTLYWGGRRKQDLYALAQCEAWVREIPGFRFVPVLSEPTAACAWTGPTGLVHQAVMQDLPDMSGHQVYACGAPVMVESARRDFVLDCKLNPADFHADAFLTAKEKSPTSPA